ncbi:MAG: hypothetical protein RIB59_10700, partial [Rhodospirillales bacterium]
MRGQKSLCRQSLCRKSLWSQPVRGGGRRNELFRAPAPCRRRQSVRREKREESLCGESLPPQSLCG